MKSPQSIRAWAAWPSSVKTPDWYQPSILPDVRPRGGLTSPYVIGHRAAAGLAPENTLAAVREALKAGVDCIEVDVWHVDGELVVIHDSCVERTTNGVGYVEDFSLHDLRMLDAGQCQRVPLLEEVINLVHGRCNINIELKGPDCAEAAVEAVNAAVRTERWQRQQFILSSFDHTQLRRVRELDPAIRCGLLLCGAPDDLAAYVRDLGVFSVHFSRDFARPEWIQSVQAAGCWAFVYTVNDISEAARLRAAGVDGFFTDFPPRLLAIAPQKKVA